MSISAMEAGSGLVQGGSPHGGLQVRLASGSRQPIGSIFLAGIRNAIRCACLLFVLPSGVWVSVANAQTPRAEHIRLLNRAMDAAQHGQLEEALQIDGELLESSPELLPALKLRGALLEQLGRALEANEAYAKALRLAPRDADLRMKRAELALLRKDDQSAIEELRLYCQLRPADAAGFFYLAQALHRSSRFDDAMKELRQAIRLEPRNAAFLEKQGEWLTASGNARDGAAVLARAQRIDPALERIDFDLGLAAYYELDYARAAQQAESALARTPGDASALQLLAASSEQLSDWNKTLAACQQQLQSDPANARAMLGAGHAQLEMGDMDGAIESLRHALNIDPALAAAHFYLARAYARQGRQEEARHELQLHQQMMRYAYAPSKLGQETGTAVWQQATEQVLAGHEAEAVALIANARKDNREHPGEAYVLAGSLCMSLSQWEQGEALLRRAIELQPDVRGAHTYLGLSALQKEDLDLAEQQFQQELKRHANYLPAIEGLGEVRYRQQRWEEVARTLTEAHPTSPRSLYLLIDASFHLGQRQNARLNAEMAAAYSHNDAEALHALEDLLRRNGELALADKIAGR